MLGADGGAGFARSGAVARVGSAFVATAARGFPAQNICAPTSRSRSGLLRPTTTFFQYTNQLPGRPLKVRKALIVLDAKLV